MEVSLVRTEPHNSVKLSSFLLSIMALAGYGRGLTYKSAPRSAEPLPTDELGVEGAFEEAIRDLDRQAKESGFREPTDDKWVRAGVGSWKSTSAGVSPMRACVKVRGKEIDVKVQKKAGVGAVMGESAFKREGLGKKLTKMSPGHIGYRDVPYKMTRPIFVVNLPTQHAQIAVASHLVDYISTEGKSGGRIDERLDPSHCTTRPASTSGRRLLDNFATIAASGSMDVLALGTDLSEFDSHCVGWNFREPMLRALKECGRGNHYGPELIPHHEMVDYAFGKGVIYDTYWDNGREPLVCLKMDMIPKEVGYDKYFTRINVGERVEGLRPLKGDRLLASGPAYVFNVDQAIEEGIKVPWDILRVVARGDGEDLIHLTSEASGELTTLCMNTVCNLVMQRLVLKELRKTEFSRMYQPLFQKAVGDDAEWIGKIGVISDPQVIEEALDVMQAAYAKMGHRLSKFKTYVNLMSSEHVQSYGRYGLYIPKDQIMVIASERPRDVRNPVAFLSSFRSVLLTKMARGMEPKFAHLVLLFH